MNIQQILLQESFSNIVLKGVRLTHFDQNNAFFEAFNDTYVQTQVLTSFSPQLRELLNYVDGSDEEGEQVNEEEEEKKNEEENEKGNTEN